MVASPKLIQEIVKPAEPQSTDYETYRLTYTFKGTFHLMKILIILEHWRTNSSGGRKKLDFTGEENKYFWETTLIQDRLEEILRTIITKYRPLKVGPKDGAIMGIGDQKETTQPPPPHIVKQFEQACYCG